MRSSPGPRQSPVAAARERLRDLWRTRRGNVAVEDVDVAPSGTAAVCLRERPDRRSNAWRVRVVRRSAAGAWSGPVLVAAPRRFLDDVECAVDDAGGVVLAWHEAMGPGVLRASAVSAAGAVAPAVTLGQGPEEPRVEMAPDGTAVVTFIAHEPDGRPLRVAEHARAWSPAARVATGEATLFGARLAIDGTGRRVLGWSGGAPPEATIRLATGATAGPAAATVLRRRRRPRVARRRRPRRRPPHRREQRLAT